MSKHHTITIHAEEAEHAPAGHQSHADHIRDVAARAVAELKAAGHRAVQGGVTHGVHHELHHD